MQAVNSQSGHLREVKNMRSMKAIFVALAVIVSMNVAEAKLPIVSPAAELAFQTGAGRALAEKYMGWPAGTASRMTGAEIYAQMQKRAAANENSPVTSELNARLKEFETRTASGVSAEQAATDVLSLNQAAGSNVVAFKPIRSSNAAKAREALGEGGKPGSAKAANENAARAANDNVYRTALAKRFQNDSEVDQALGREALLKDSQAARLVGERTLLDKGAQTCYDDFSAAAVNNFNDFHVAAMDRVLRAASNSNVEAKYVEAADGAVVAYMNKFRVDRKVAQERICTLAGGPDGKTCNMWNQGFRKAACGL